MFLYKPVESVGERVFAARGGNLSACPRTSFGERCNRPQRPGPQRVMKDTIVGTVSAHQMPTADSGVVTVSSTNTMEAASSSQESNVRYLVDAAEPGSESRTSPTSTSGESQLKKPEVLAPAGGWKQLYAAVENGADAVYFGLTDFNARARY